MSRAKLKTFVGFKGTCATVEISGITFMIIAATPAQLETIWRAILPDAEPFDPDRCKKGILIEAKNLPEDTKPLPIPQT